MKQWQKLLLDPAAHTLLRQLEFPKTKKQLTKQTGLEEERIQKLLEKLEESKLVNQKIESGIRKYRLNDNHNRIKQLRLEIEEHTILEVENAVKTGNFRQARKLVHRNPPVENIQKRRTIAKIEALQKLEQLPKTIQKTEKTGRWQSLKGFIPRF